MIGVVRVVVELDVGGLKMIVGVCGGDQHVVMMVVVWSTMVGAGGALFVLLRYHRSEEAGHVVDYAFGVQKQLIFGRTVVLDWLLTDKAKLLLLEQLGVGISSDVMTRIFLVVDVVTAAQNGRPSIVQFGLAGHRFVARCRVV